MRPRTLTDIVQRLRAPRRTTQFDRAGRLIEFDGQPSDLEREAADEIERLEREVESLKDALQWAEDHRQ